MTQLAPKVSIPARITEIKQQDSLLMGMVDFGGVLKEVCLDYVPEAQVGQYVLIHVGFAISVLDEQEAVAQIFPDGSYSMYSLNYHRFILHIYLYAMRLGELNGSPFSYSLERVVTNSIDYLFQN